MGATAGAVALAPWLSDEGVLAFASLKRNESPPVPKVLSPGDLATLDALAEAILPADERSPGARAARVAEYIDLLLSESEAEARAHWLAGLAAVNEVARARWGASFEALDTDQAGALLTLWSANEQAPQTPLEIFFKQTKDATIRGYYTSEIGIHQELRYKGNTFNPEFVGCLVEEGRDCPHCGQKAAP
jgi:hypothetical protein